MSSQRTIVVLAAGRSERFGAGRHKLAQPLGATSVLAQTPQKIPLERKETDTAKNLPSEAKKKSSPNRKAKE